MEKFLTFDCYGTLLNEDTMYSRIEEIGNELGVDGKDALRRFVKYRQDPSNVHPYVDYDLFTRNNLINLDFQFGLDHKFEEYYVDVLEAHRDLKPFPEVVDTLKKFISMDYKLIMMSNSAWSLMRNNSAALEVPFDVWTAEDVHAHKPDLHFFKEVQEHYNFTPENHIHIAQGYGYDIVPCAQMKWPSIWVNRDNDQPTESARPTHEVKTLDEVLPYLEVEV
ncbi:HAD family hydrolase [Companilactobacillus sp.]|uniref:HAD family hydrolase n=1 Tax=Companilactobacillus sp. TaxID=2767905 RepID=UPI0025BA7602|nr:HAD family hydrolase [Companilactobacillus sp.]MCH4009539.1 HAD hydrolase-like protein [Companilactobacillus sp.]MCH4052785.1 HAD hydrolase-like protein [Companilactobacillus sp.]MCH4077481.1 HAD hydrolase-like protein [Companilactobacillus sp.]MCH4126057.1 HAD hydrolase-like protein [Companilactobacillus sp.]MCI1311765.1 HAD hydrolase-like protein [Companilactobacillus sp.]